MTIRVFIICFCFPMISIAQVDTNYVKNYSNRLILSLFQSYRNEDIFITQIAARDSTGASSISYLSSSRLINGIGVDWDKISFSLSWKSPTPNLDEDRTGTSSSQNLSFGINARKFRIEGSFHNYKGFFDSNIVNLENFSDTSRYYQNDDLIAQSVKIKSLYFRNKKNRFSYMAAYANTHRQVKSALTFVLISSIYYQKMASSQGIIGSYIPQQYYPDYRNLNRIDVTSLTLTPGFSGTLVLFKRFFVNGTLAWGPEIQIRKLFNGDQIESKAVLSWTASETRIALGYNGKNFLVYSWAMGDYDMIRYGSLQVNRQMIFGGIALGYRFSLKPNRVTRFIQENKYYKMI